MTLIKGLLTTLFACALLLASPFPAFAQSNQSNWGTCLVNDVPTIGCVESLFTNILTVALYILGLAVFIMLIVGGLKILFSSGDPKQVEAGRNTVFYAVLGLAGVFIVWFIMLFLSDFTGIDSLLEFDLSF